MADLEAPRQHGDDDHRPTDLVGVGFWDELWASGPLRRYKWFNYYHRAQDRFLRRLLPRGGRFLELGCANSLWVARFAADHEVWGIDYSTAGVAKLRPIAEAMGARVVVGDVFDPANGIRRAYFDVVFSDGLLEHFADAAAAACRFAQYLAPGGVLVTNVPNMSGWIGALHRAVAPQFYAEHVRHTLASFDAAHERAGLRPVVAARYWGHLSLGVVNYERHLRRLPRAVARGVFTALLAVQQLLAWSMAILRIPESALLSPYIRGAYERPRASFAPTEFNHQS